MTIEISRETLKSQAFNTALSKLSRYTGFAPTKLRKISKILKKLRNADKESGEAWEKAIQPFIQKDAEGKIIPEVKDGKPLPNSFAITEDKKAAFAKVLEDFENTMVKVEVHTIHVNDLQGVGITPNEFIAIEPLVHGLDLMEGGANGEESEEKQESESQEKSH